MSLADVWFVLIAVLWAGYFVLEGFDFGVGMLLPFVGRDERDREAMIETIGPVWDGNEVWLVVAGGAMFAAFPAWYGTSFSGLYLALLLVLVCLILRVVSFEWGARGDHPRWRSAWRWANTVASVVAPFVWGVALASFLGGLPIDADGHYAGTMLDLFTPYTVLAGVAVAALFALHGATFLCLRTDGTLRERAGAAARRLAVPAAMLVAALLVCTVFVAHDRNARGVVGPAVPAAVGVVAVALAAALVLARRRRPAFLATAAGAAAIVATIYVGLYPRVMVSRPEFEHSLTVAGTASAHYTLVVMTVVAAIFLPLVLAYQGWTYHVFRARAAGEPAGD